MRKNILASLVFLLLTPQLVTSQEKNILSPNDSVPTKNIEIQVTPRTQFKLGGAVWIRSAFQDWQENNSANRQGLYFDQFRISIDGEHSLDGQAKLTFSSQARWWSYQFAIHHLWFGIKFNENHEARYGVTQAPFGAMPAISSSFWYSLNYYHGLEGDHDAGFRYLYTKDGFDLQFGYFRNGEYNDPTALNRWAPDLVVSGDQGNFERNQFNLRLAYVFGKGTDYSSEFGISGEVGQIKNTFVEEDGDRWAAAIHYVGYYNNWNFYAQGTRYEYNPVNPEGVDDRTVLMGFFSDQRLVAAEGTTLVGGVRRFWDVDWWLLDKINAYVEYSTVLKDVAEFNDSRLFNPGVVFQAGPFYVWMDLLMGQNAWYFNDSQANSGPGAGANNPDKWEFRYNFSLQWYF
jgi:hypothetical protein